MIDLTPPDIDQSRSRNKSGVNTNRSFRGLPVVQALALQIDVRNLVLVEEPQCVLAGRVEHVLLAAGHPEQLRFAFRSQVLEHSLVFLLEPLGVQQTANEDADAGKCVRASQSDAERWLAPADSPASARCCRSAFTGYCFST